MKKSSVTKIGAMVLILAVAIQSCSKKKQPEPTASPVSQVQISQHSAQRQIVSYESDAAFGERTDDKNEPCRHKDQSICKFSITLSPEVPADNVRVTVGIEDNATISLAFNREILNNVHAYAMFDQTRQLFTLPTDAGLQDPTGRYMPVTQQIILRSGSYAYSVDDTGKVLVTGIKFVK